MMVEEEYQFPFESSKSEGKKCRIQLLVKTYGHLNEFQIN